jgi:hypothetical protein
VAFVHVALTIPDLCQNRGIHVNGILRGREIPPNTFSRRMCTYFEINHIVCAHRSVYIDLRVKLVRLVSSNLEGFIVSPNRECDGTSLQESGFVNNHDILGIMS